MTIQEKIDALQKYISLESDETAEVAQCLCSAAGYQDYMSEECFRSIEKEITDSLQHYQTRTRIVTREETYTVTELEWT